VRSDGSAQALGNATDAGDARSPLHPPYYPKRYEAPATNAVGGAYLAPGPQAAATGPLRVTFLGDSLSVITGRNTRRYVATHHDGVHVATGGIIGCGISGSMDLAVYSNPGPPRPTLPACAQWQQEYRRALALTHPDTVVLLLGFWESQRHAMPHHGVVTTAKSKAYRDYVTAQLKAVGSMVDAAGARLVVMTAPYYGDGTPKANVDAYNAVLHAALPQATFVDLHSLLDPNSHYTPVVNGIRARTNDHVHLTINGVEKVVDPVLVPVVLDAARQSRATG
jgi:hypothetical protein